MRLILITLIFAFFNLSISAQQEKEDSLRNIFENTENDSLKLEAMLEYANLIYNKRPKESEKTAKNLVQLGKLHNNTSIEAGGNFVLGIISFTRSDYEKATKFYLKSLEGFSKSENNADKIPAVYNNIGLIYYVQENFNKALEYYQKTINYIDSSNYDGKDTHYYNALMNTGVIYSEKNEFSKAKSYLQELPKFYEDNNDLMGLAYTYQTLGMIAAEEHNLNLVEEYFGRAIRASEVTNIPTIKVSVLLGASSGYSKIENHQKALAYAQRADSLISKYELPDLYDLMSAKEIIAQSNYSLKNFKKSYEVLQERITIGDSLYSSEMSAANQELIEKYQSEQKEQEIELLKEKDKVSQLELSRKDDRLKVRTYFILFLSLIIILLIVISFFIYRQIRLKQQKKAVQLEHKALRTQMNPHFIFNSLNSIQRMYVEGNTDEANDFLTEFSGLIRNILENSNYNKIALNEEISTLKSYLELEKLRTKDKFDFTITVDESIDPYNYQVPPLVIQPFVENAIWHGILPGDRKGEIQVKLTKVGDRIHVEVMDNGVGFSAENTKKHESKGIKITEKRIGSKVNIQSSAEGTKIDFTI